jgi:hypothetical protein
MISLKRFIEGGAAIFAAVNKNHHIDSDGKIHNIPLVKKMLRVDVISYDIFAKINRADDLKPWASIMVSAPINPQILFDKIPANINPI